MGMYDDMRRFYEAQNLQAPRPPDPQMKAIGEQAFEMLERLLASGAVPFPRNSQVLADRLAMQLRQAVERQAAQRDRHPRRVCVRMR